MSTAATEYHRSTEDSLKAFVAAVLVAAEVEPADAAIAAEVVVAADLRGIESYGVATLGPSYVRKLRTGQMTARPKVETIRETATSILVDGANGLGPPVAHRVMQAVIAKAKQHGAAFATVRNSNDFGIAGYYAMLGLADDLVGMASTNGVRAVAPTYGRDPMLGTNPFAYAVPADREPAFVLDFATATMPPDMGDRTGPLRGLPLGGLGVDTGGHKGYGLGMLADIFCGVLSGGKFGSALPAAVDGPASGAIAHWFAAFRVDAFRDVAAFKHDMDEELRAFKHSAKSPGHERIYVAGEIEHERTLAYRRDGVPISGDVWNGLQTLSAELDVPFTLESATA